MTSSSPVIPARDVDRAEPLPKQADLSTDELDLRKFIAQIWRGKWIIGAMTALGLAIGGIYAYRIAVPLYSSSAELALQTEEDRTLVDIEGVVSGLGTDWQMINTEIRIIRSRSMMRKLAQELDLVRDPRFNRRLAAELSPPSPTLRQRIGALFSTVFAANAPEAGAPAATPAEPSEEDIISRIASELRGMVSVSNARDSFVLNIGVTATDPVLAADLANALAEVYIADQVEYKYAATDRAAEWLAEQVSALRGELEAAEEKVNEFNSATELVSPETLEAQNRQLKDLRDRLEMAQFDLGDAQARSTALTQARASGDAMRVATVAEDPRLTRLATDLIAGRIDQAPFDARFQQVLERTALEAELATSQVDALEQSIIDLSARVDAQSADLVVLQQLEREAEASRLIYESFLLRLREISVQQGIQQPDARVISEATVRLVPIAPRKSRILAISLILGALGGIAVVVLRDMLRPRGFRTADELQQETGLVVMGQVPLLPVKRRSDLVPYLVAKPASAGAEAVRNLRTSLLLSNLDTPPQILLVSSCLPEEGKSTLSVMLSQSLAGMGRRVLLIEGDIRRRVFGQYFETTGEAGFVSVLSGDADLKETILHDARIGLDLLPGERTRVNAADLFTSDRFQNFLAELRTVYDHIIIDTPPVLVVPDARIIGHHVDAVLLSVRWDRTSPDQVREGINAFRTVGLNVTGLTLNSIDPKKMRSYGYGRGYGGYGYGAKGYYRN